MRITTVQELSRNMTAPKKTPLYAKVIGSLIIALVFTGAVSGLLLLIVTIWRVIL